jgi:hypothetical protein
MIRLINNFLTRRLRFYGEEKEFREMRKRVQEHAQRLIDAGQVVGDPRCDLTKIAVYPLDWKSP